MDSVNNIAAGCIVINSEARRKPLEFDEFDEYIYG